MKDLGIRQGSGAFAVPLVVMPDAVYVHTDRNIPDLKRLYVRFRNSV